MVYLGADHGGFELKKKIKKYLDQKKIPYEDLGTHSLDPVDYPDYAFAVSKKVLKGDPEKDKGVMICTTGIGSCVAVNKIKGIRGAMGYSEEAVERARHDIDVNVLCLGGKTIEHNQALEMVDLFLNTPFSQEERHSRRIKKIQAREKE